jgi:hypothetical protein
MNNSDLKKTKYSITVEQYAKIIWAFATFCIIIISFTKMNLWAKFCEISGIKKIELGI